MIRDFNSMVGARVLEQSTGQELAFISGVILDPDTGVVEAFWVKPLTIPVKNAVLKASDILEFKKHLYIKGERVLAQAEDLIRISEILEDGRVFMGAPVLGESGVSYGRCVNLTFDTQTFTLRQIYTRKSLLGLISLSERIFSYGDIVKVLPAGILVKDEAAKRETVMGTSPEAAAG